MHAHTRLQFIRDVVDRANAEMIYCLADRNWAVTLLKTLVKELRLIHRSHLV